MSSRLTLSVVDQSPVRKGGSAADALRETIELAVAAERFGYARYWVAEHHNNATLAATSPEIMVGQIAARTRSMRVGSGGVMLTHYSPLKVAENFRVLESLYPGRIDLGIGRAPGGDRRTAAALAFPSRPYDIRRYPQQVLDLIGYLSDTMDPDHPFAGIRAAPTAGSMPEIWLLGSGVDSAELAARLGLPLSYAGFSRAGVDQGPAMVDLYRRHFRPSAYLNAPRVNVAVSLICVDSEREAEQLRATLTSMRVSAARGGVEAIGGEASGDTPYSPEEVAFLEQTGRADIVGDAEHVKAALEEICARYRTDDLSIVNIWHDFAARVRSYELIAHACGVSARDVSSAATAAF